jgi:hypothetical protein
MHLRSDVAFLRKVNEPTMDAITGTPRSIVLARHSLVRGDDTLNRIKIFVASPTDKESKDEIERLVNELIGAHEKAGVTWLQSSAIQGDRIGETSTMYAQHVLTAIVKWDDSLPPAGGGLAKSPVLAQRTGSGKAWR